LPLQGKKGKFMAESNNDEKSKSLPHNVTSADWLFMAHSAFTQNIAIVTAYDTLGESGLLHSMNETEVEAIFTNGDLLSTLLKILPSCPSLKHVIYNGEAKQEVLEKVRAQIGSVLSLRELKALGRQNPTPPVKPKGEDICCIMYTSGSTGNPKGVILKHSNLVAASKFFCDKKGILTTGT
jgi:long-chain acyl-CoA synthetase